jgi:hypothetical protein
MTGRIQEFPGIHIQDYALGIFSSHVRCDRSTNDKAALSNMDTITTNQELEAVDAELEQLELQLQIAREKKAALAREREQREQLRVRELQEQKAPHGNHGDANDLQRQIEELKLQLTLQEIELQKNLYKHPNNGISNAHGDEQKVQPTPLQEVQYHSNNHDVVKGVSEQAKQKHSWEKPAWALPSEAIPDDSILKDSIQNPMLKAPVSTGYERKVHEANLALIPGKFVQPTKAKVVEPRMVWIVVNIDGCKVGKIVMHLYGNFLPLTDIFTELKGLELFRCDTNTLVITDIDPNFYVHVGNASSFSKKFSKQANDCCYGVVLEGQDILAQVFNAPSDAILTVKQSHIFPVKKTK